VQPLSTRIKNSILAITAITLLALPVLSASAKGKAFPHVIDVLEGSYPEGFAIGRGHTAYNGSVDGSIYKIDLRSGKGKVLNPQETPDPMDCSKLGMRFHSRTNNLFVAGCVYGNANVYNADTGKLKNTYMLAPDDEFSIINDLTITKDAVYFTDSYLPYIYRLPLGRNGRLPSNADGVTRIDLPDEFILDPENDFCCGGNGIVSTRNGKTLIVGHSNLSALYRVTPATGEVVEIEVSPPLTGFLDGFVLHGRTLYIMNPDLELVQVVELDKKMLTGEFVGTIYDPNMSGIASGALFGRSLYVNNAHYDAVVYDDDGNPVFDDDGNPVFNYTERSITKLNRHAVEPVD